MAGKAKGDAEMEMLQNTAKKKRAVVYLGDHHRSIAESTRTRNGVNMTEMMLARTKRKGKEVIKIRVFAKTFAVR